MQLPSFSGRLLGGPYVVEDGLATLGPSATGLVRDLDDILVRWAETNGAKAMTFPPLLSAASLSKLDYFRNFPHLGTVVSHIRSECLDHYTQSEMGQLPAEDLADSTHILPSAACYSAYLHLQRRALDTPVLITMVATCFRREETHDSLRRLWSFRMREVVCVGDAEAVMRHLEVCGQKIEHLAVRLGLDLNRLRATDPFFRKDDPRALFQAIEPTKEEFSSEGIALASLNFHRNFFGERCGITIGGAPAFTSCAAFGLERWLYALCRANNGDIDQARRALTSVRKTEGSGGPQSPL